MVEYSIEPQLPHPETIARRRVTQVGKYTTEVIERLTETLVDCWDSSGKHMFGYQTVLNNVPENYRDEVLNEVILCIKRSGEWDVELIRRNDKDATIMSIQLAAKEKT